MEFNENLKQLRIAKGLNQKDFAESLKEVFGEAVETSKYNKWENGKNKPDFDTLIKMAEYFEVSTDYLLGRTEIKSQDPTIKVISKNTGLSEKAIENLYIHCTCYDMSQEGITGTSIVLNRLLEQDDFMKLLAGINLHFIEAENKEYYTMEQKRHGNDSSNSQIQEFVNLIKSEPITLNSLQYFNYSNNEIKEDFIKIVNNIVIEHISSIDIETEVISRRNNWDEEQKQMGEIWDNYPEEQAEKDIKEFENKIDYIESQKKGV